MQTRRGAYGLAPFLVIERQENSIKDEGRQTGPSLYRRVARTLALLLGVEDIEEGRLGLRYRTTRLLLFGDLLLGVRLLPGNFPLLRRGTGGETISLHRRLAVDRSAGGVGDTLAVAFGGRDTRRLHVRARRWCV